MVDDDITHNRSESLVWQSIQAVAGVKPNLMEIRAYFFE